MRPRPSIAYAEVLRDLGRNARNLGVWTHVGHVTRAHGWKLHLSSVQTQAARLLEHVAPVLVRYGAPFKFARDDDILCLLNEGLLGATQVGKFITIYSDELKPADRRALTDELLAIAASGEFVGPSIVTDAPLGGVLFLRYGEYRGIRVRNRLGLFESDPQDRQLTEYRVPFTVPDGAADPSTYRLEHCEDRVPPLAPIGPGYLRAGLLANHPKGAVYEAIDLRDPGDAGLIVLKQARAWTMSDGYGRDARDRLENQASMLRALQGRVNVPRVMPTFEHDDALYLPLERIEGADATTLAGIPYRERAPDEQARLLETLRLAATELIKMHAAGFAHRDISPANLRLADDGRVFLIDLELAFELADTCTVPFSQGTVGYVSPQQLRNDPPSTADDVYSMAAVIAALCGGIEAYHLPVESVDLAARLRELSGLSEHLSVTLAEALSADDRRRPTMEKVVDALANEPPPAARTAVSRRDGAFSDAACRGIWWILEQAPRDPATSMWLSPALEEAHVQHERPVPDWRVYRSASRGVAGVVYVLSKLHRFGLLEKERISGDVEGAADWLLAHRDSPDDQLPGLHFGEAGVAVALCEAVRSRAIVAGDWLRPYLTEVFACEPDWPDFTHGAAGQLLGSLLCDVSRSEPEAVAAALPYAGYLVETQSLSGSWPLPEGIEGMAGMEFTGFAHGTAGVVYALARIADITGDDTYRTAAEEGAGWLMDEAFVSATDNSLRWNLHPATQQSWTWWCHGSPGVALAFLAMYRLTGSQKYEGSARASLRGISIDPRASNLSQCHGLAGLGEIMLDAYDVLGDKEYLRRATNIGHALTQIARPIGAAVAWNTESRFTREVDLMNGCAGPIHFLARLAVDDPMFGSPLQLPWH